MNASLNSSHVAGESPKGQLAIHDIHQLLAFPFNWKEANFTIWPPAQPRATRIFTFSWSSEPEYIIGWSFKNSVSFTDKDSSLGRWGGIGCATGRRSRKRIYTSILSQKHGHHGLHRALDARKEGHDHGVFRLERCLLPPMGYSNWTLHFLSIIALLLASYLFTTVTTPKWVHDWRERCLTLQD